MWSKIKTIGWYLKQPKGVGLVLNLIRQKTTFRKLENTSEESVAWCSKHAVDTQTALKKLFPDKSPALKEIFEIYPQEFQYAKKKFESTPYQMGGAGNMNLLFNVCELIGAKYVLETGVAYGWSSLSILLSISKNPASLLVSTDMPYAKMGNENFVGIVVSESLRKNWKLIQEADLSGLPKAFQMADHFDVIHYDSDKSYVGRMDSYLPIYTKLRKGGIFISDDIQDNIAFKDFCERMNIVPVVISFDGKFVGAFVK
jgi:predicted O-methyltransferase YrrM